MLTSIILTYTVHKTQSIEFDQFFQSELDNRTIFQVHSNKNIYIVTITTGKKNDKKKKSNNHSHHTNINIRLPENDKDINWNNGPMVHVVYDAVFSTSFSYPNK